MTDEELIKLYKSGKKEAGDELLERYKSLVLSACRNLYIMGAEKDDLIQEGMIGLFSALNDYREDRSASFLTFANLCVRRQLYKAIEASQTAKNSPLNSYISLYGSGDESDMIEELEAEDSDPQSLIIEDEQIKLLKKKLYDTLSKMEKTVFDLYLEGLEYREIAQKLGKKDKAIDNCLQRIRAKAMGIGESTYKKENT